MELELGLKITRTREDVSSSVDFRFSKDPFGPLVLSQETNSRFIIIIHLKGFKKEGIEIDINEDGNRITISGRKPVEEMVMIRWMAWRKQVEFRVFKKVFRIPDVVDLDKIKARFDDDDATLTITMPKRVKGISGFNIEEEEVEESVDFGDVSETAEHKEETENEVEDESIEREESEIQKDEKFGETVETKEGENQVLGEEQKGFSGGLDKEEAEDDYLEKSHQIDERVVEEEEEEELADSNKESEDSSLRKPPDFEGRDSHEQTRHKGQEDSQQLVQAESRSDDFGSRAFEEIGEQEPDVLDKTSKCRTMEKEIINDDGDGLRQVQGIEEPEGHNEESQIQTMVEGENGGHEKKKVVKMEIRNRDAKEEVDGKMGEGFRPYIDGTQVVAEDDVGKTETKAEGFESDKVEGDEVDKIHELVEKKEEEGENAKDRSLIKLQENEKLHPEGKKRHSKQEKMKELVEEKSPAAETDIGNDILKPFQQIQVPKVATVVKTGDEGKEGKEKKTSLKEIKSGDAKEEIDVKMGEVFASNLGDRAMKSEDFECDKLESVEVEKMQKSVEKKDKKEENAKVRAQSEDISLTTLPEIGEQQFQEQKPHAKQEEFNELVEEQTPEVETNIGNDIPKPVQERCEGKHKIQEETKNQPEEYKGNIMETEKNSNDAAGRKVQELDEPARSGKESKTQELVKSKRNDEEKEIAEMETEEQVSNRPKILREQEKIQELAEDKTNFSKNDKVKEVAEIAEKKTEFGDDDNISRKVRDIEQRGSHEMNGQEEKDMTQELVLEEKVSDGGKGIIAVEEKKDENDKSKKVQESDELQSPEEDTFGKQEKLIGGEISGRGEVEDVENKKKTTETDNRIQDRTKEAQEIEKTDSDVSKEYSKGTMIQENEKNRVVYRNEHEELKKDEADRPEKITDTIEQELVNQNSQLEQDNVEKSQEMVEEKIKDCEEEEGNEESKTITDDVVRLVQRIKQQELNEPKEFAEETGDHEKEEEKKIAELELCGSLRKVYGCEEQELHEPKIHKERDKNRKAGAEQPSGQEEAEKKIVESMTMTENDNSTNVQAIKDERPEKPESQEKRYKVQEVVEEQRQEKKIMSKAELETGEESSRKLQEIEQEEYDGLKRSMVQEMMQETEEKEKTRAMEENEILERRKKAKDGSLRNVQDDGNPELAKPYKRQKKNKVPELVEMGTSDYREKVKKQDENNILRSQEDLDEFETHGVQSNVPQMVEEERVENISELGGKLEDDDSSGKLHELEEGKSYEDGTHEEHEKMIDSKKEEATDPKYKHTGGEDHKEEENVIAKKELKTEEDSSKKDQDIEKQEYGELKRSTAQNKMQETDEKDKSSLMEENEIVERREKTNDGSLRMVLEGEDPELGKQKRHGEEDRIHELVKTEMSDHRGKVKKKNGDDISKSKETGKLDLGELERRCKQRKIHQWVEDEKGEGKIENISERGGKSEEFENVVKEVTDLKDKHTGGEGEEEEERYEKVAETKAKDENENNKKVGEDKHERYRNPDKLEGVLREGTGDREEEENLVDGFTTKIEETEKEESHELEMHEKQNIVPDSVEDETWDQENEEAEEVAAKVASNKNGSSREVQTIEEEESEKQKEENKIPETSDSEVKEEDDEKVSEKETKELGTHVQEPEEKADYKYDGEGRRGENVNQGNIVGTMSPERFKTKSDDGVVRKIKETNVEESNEKKYQELKGKIEELKRVETPDLVNEDEEQADAETKINVGKSNENEEQKKIGKPMEEKSNAPEKEKEGNEKISEEEMRDKIESRIKDQEIKGENPSELLRNGEHEKIPECHREEEKQMEQREIEEMKRKAEDVSSRKVQQIKAQESDESEKHLQKLSEIQESSNIQESVEKETQKHREQEMNEKAVLKKKTVASSESQAVEEKGSVQPKRYAEQELMTEEERKEEYRIREGEQKEKTKRMPQVDSKANDDSSEKNDTEGIDSTGLRGENHQELVEIETSDKRKEEIEEEKVVGKSETYEYDSSRKIHEHEERKSDELERHGEEKMSKKLAEQGTSDDKGAKEVNRAREVWEEVETKIRADGFGKVRDIEEQEQDKKQLYVEKNISGKRKENKNQETKRRDDSSGNKTQENEKQKSHEQKRNEEEVVEKEEIIDQYDSDDIAEEKTNNEKEAKEGNIAEAELGEVEKKLGNVTETEEKEQNKKQTLETDTSGKAKENKNQESKTRDDSSGKQIQENEKQKSSHEPKRNEEQDKKNLGLVGENTNYCSNEEDGKDNKEIAEAEVTRKLKGIEKRESTKKVERKENRDSTKEIVEENMKKQEGEDKVLEKSENDESKVPEGLRKQDNSREQRVRDKLKDEGTAKTETKGKDNESRKTHRIKEQETSEQERLKEQGKIKELVEDRTQFCREKENRETEFEDGRSKKTQEIEKEESNKPGRYEKREKIQEPEDRETSEDDEEELEIEFEDEEEDWEAEVIQETDSDEDKDKIRQIKRIRLGFRLVGGSTLFMSLIVIVISFIRSKRKIRCYKF